jgi:tRNA threonylcarbamoyladenosine biosynthesis protein TsaE
MNRNDFVNKTFVTNNFKETQDLGHSFAKFLEKGDIVCLYGDLGGGKTTFTQGLSKKLGIKNRIISPTFVIVRRYELKDVNFYHIDLYRIENKKDLEGLGIEEILNNRNNITIIEWAEKLGEYLPEKRIDIKFSYENNDARRITFRSTNQ